MPTVATRFASTPSRPLSAPGLASAWPGYGTAQGLNNASASFCLRPSRVPKNCLLVSWGETATWYSRQSHAGHVYLAEVGWLHTCAHLKPTHHMLKCKLTHKPVIMRTHPHMQAHLKIHTQTAYGHADSHANTHTQHMTHTHTYTLR